jgi:hypothetical protein
MLMARRLFGCRLGVRCRAKGFSQTGPCALQMQNQDRNKDGAHALHQSLAEPRIAQVRSRIVTLR